MPRVGAVLLFAPVGAASYNLTTRVSGCYINNQPNYDPFCSASASNCAKCVDTCGGVSVCGPGWQGGPSPSDPTTDMSAVFPSKCGISISSPFSTINRAAKVVDSGVTWWYSWGATPPWGEADPDAKARFVPMWWGPESRAPNGATKPACGDPVPNGAKAVFMWNEMDLDNKGVSDPCGLSAGSCWPNVRLNPEKHQSLWTKCAQDARQANVMFSGPSNACGFNGCTGNNQPSWTKRLLNGLGKQDLPQFWAAHYYFDSCRLQNAREQFVGKIDEWVNNVRAANFGANPQIVFKELGILNKGCNVPPATIEATIRSAVQACVAHENCLSVSWFSVDDQRHPEVIPAMLWDTNGRDVHGYGRVYLDECKKGMRQPTRPTPAPATPPGNAACAAHSGCSALAGDCCPAPGGVMLSCCSAPPAPAPPATPPPSSAACSAHAACAAAGLAGDCCPAAGGVMLGCC